jgi:acyl transferase domain-containing protein
MSTGNGINGAAKWLQGADIAIVGMACVFPGARDAHVYWENIVDGVDAIGDPPPDWNTGSFFDPEERSTDRIYCRRGGYLGELAQFQPLDYGIMPVSVDGGEPDHYLALRLAYDALADAGYQHQTYDGKRVGVILGRGTYINRGWATLFQHGVVVDQTLRILKQLHPEYTDEELLAIRRELKASLPPFNAETAPGLIPNIITGRIANRLNLMGPNYIVDAACASAMVSVEMATRELLAGRCDVALAGGIHASTPPPLHMIFCQMNALSQGSQIRPFDKGADGTILGEGAGILVLKRREDAERQGDRIYALIKGIGVASDGRGVGLMAPRLEGEVLALGRAYEMAGVSPSSIGLIEAHGTATPVGDPTEVRALRKVFESDENTASRRCALGTVKSMIGHTLPAAGAAGLIKTALALHHKILPPTLHCEDPISDLEDSPFYINREARPWIHGAAGHPRRAGVNAFGFGGINAHIILEEYT